MRQVDVIATGNKILSMQIQTGIGTVELARRLYITRQSVFGFTHGLYMPSIDTLVAMTEIFDCTLDDLVGIVQSR